MTTTQINFRIDEKTHLKAKAILVPNGGVSKYLKEEASKFVKHEISLNPYIVKNSSKEKRISMKSAGPGRQRNLSSDI